VEVNISKGVNFKFCFLVKVESRLHNVAPGGAAGGVNGRMRANKVGEERLFSWNLIFGFFSSHRILKLKRPRHFPLHSIHPRSIHANYFVNVSNVSNKAFSSDLIVNNSKDNFFFHTFILAQKQNRTISFLSLYFFFILLTNVSYVSVLIITKKVTMHFFFYFDHLLLAINDMTSRRIMLMPACVLDMESIIFCQF